MSSDNRYQAGTWARGYAIRDRETGAVIGFLDYRGAHDVMIGLQNGTESFDAYIPFDEADAQTFREF